MLACTQGCTSRRKEKVLSPSSAMGVHAALQLMACGHAVKAGTPLFKLTDDAGYAALYKHYTKNRGLRRTHEVAATFTNESCMKFLRTLAADGTADAIKAAAMWTLGVATVTRGDEMRDIKWAGFNHQISDAIGACATHPVYVHVSVAERWMQMRAHVMGIPVAPRCMRPCLYVAGPLTCPVITFALGDRKTCNGKPDIKAFIRNRCACKLHVLANMCCRLLLALLLATPTTNTAVASIASLQAARGLPSRHVGTAAAPHVQAAEVHLAVPWQPGVRWPVCLHWQQCK